VRYPSEGLLREEIQEKVSKLYSVSKPTLIRDLNVLLVRKLISVMGKARATVYFPKIQNPLLREFDLERYFMMIRITELASEKPLILKYLIT